MGTPSDGCVRTVGGAGGADRDDTADYCAAPCAASAPACSPTDADRFVHQHQALVDPPSRPPLGAALLSVASLPLWLRVVLVVAVLLLVALFCFGLAKATQDTRALGSVLMLLLLLVCAILLRPALLAL